MTPGKARRACEGLEAVDVETRVSIIQGLVAISTGVGVIRLLELLAASESVETREAAGYPECFRRRGLQGSRRFQCGARAMG